MSAAKVARVVLDPLAKSDLFDHLEIVYGSLGDPLPFDKEFSFSKWAILSSSSVRIVSTACRRTLSGVTW